MTDFSDDQLEAVDRIDAFLRNPHPAKPWFVLGGLAGTGKTHVLAHFARRLPRSVACAYTGKAASVLSRRIGMKATTVHSAIYQFMGEGDDGELRFGAKIEDGEWEGDVALIDEHSMLPGNLLDDLLRTGARIVATGDRGQLPPVQGEVVFREDDFTLEHIHRQAWDSAIVRQAHSVRNTGVYAADGDDFRVTSHVTHEDICSADVVLCWRNATRRYLNRLLRAHRGFPDGTSPQRGEAVMCLRNDHKRGLLNGAVYELLEEHRRGTAIAVRNERGREVEVPGWIEDFDDAPWQREPIPFAMAYCCTVHKAQGSEYDSVIFVDEYDRPENRREFCYTAITRAARRILVQKGNA